MTVRDLFFCFAPRTVEGTKKEKKAHAKNGVMVELPFEASNVDHFPTVLPYTYIKKKLRDIRLVSQHRCKKENKMKKKR